MRLNIFLVMIAILALFTLPAVSAVDIYNNGYLESFSFNNATGINLNKTGTNGTVLTLVNFPNMTQGKLVNASNFSSTSSQALTATSSALYPLTKRFNTSLTVGMWVKPKNTVNGNTVTASNSQGFVLMGNNSGSGVNFHKSIGQIAGGYQYNWEITGVDYFRVNASVGIDAGNWHFLAVTYNETSRNASIYYDGVLANSTIFRYAAATVGTFTPGVEIGRATVTSYSNVSLDALVFYNETLSSTDILALYNSGLGREAPFTQTSSASNYSITAFDFYTASSLLNITVCDSFNCNSTTNGTAYLSYPSNYTSLLNFTVSSSINGGYYNQTYYNVNLSAQNWIANLSQSAVSFYATEKVSNNVLTGVSFATAYLTNQTHYMRADTYTVTATKSGYFGNSASVVASPLSISTINISNMSASYLNLSMRYNLTNAQVSNFTATFESLNYSYSETISTTNGSIYVPLIAGSWQISISGSSAAPYVFNTTLSNGMNNVTAYTFASDSFYFSVYDEITGALLNGTAVNIQVIGLMDSFNVTTTNGTWYHDLVMPDAYTVRYSSSGYTERFSYFVLDSNSHTDVSLYLLSSNLSTNVTITLYNQDRALVKNALIKILKYNIIDNTYSVKNMAFTDNDGVAYFDALYNSEFYKFFVEYPAGTLVLATEPSYIRSTQITLQYVAGISGTAFFDTVFGISQSFVFNEDTNSFRLDFNSQSNTVSAACVYVYATSNNNQLYDTACTNSTTGTVLVAVDNITGTTYQADVFYTVLSQPQYAGSQVADFTDRSDWENTGMLFVLFLTMGMVLIFRENPKLSILTISLPLIFANLVGFVSVEWWIPIAIAAMSVIIVWIISRWS